MTDPGRLFMFGAYGTKPSRETVSLFKETNATGLLLLARNIETPAQTKAYVTELEDRLGRPLLVAIDHEGGWVLRFKSGMTAFPGNAALGRTRDPKAAYAVGRQMARELAPLGIRMNLAPVLDVSTKVYNPGIGIRSFGPDPKLAGRLGAAFTRGLQDHGVSACAKHFPGKGAATVDAHVDLPTIRLPRAEFSRVHLAPFHDAVKAGVDAVMTSHVRFPAFDSVPATFSRKIVRDVLRGKLGYHGLIVSDDLCMGAVTKRWPVAVATLKCLDAGHDVLMIAHDLQGMRDAVDLIREAGADENQLAEADARIQNLLPRRRQDHAPNLDEGLDLARAIAAKAVVVARRGACRLPLPAEPGTLILVPDFREVRERFTFEDGPGGPEAMIRALAPRADVLRTPIESSGLGSLAAAVKRAENVVFLCFEARRFAGQAATLKLLAKSAPEKTVALLIRSSWDESLCPKKMTVVDAAGYRLVSLEAGLSAVLENRP
ncbi:MAG: beta-N-acetylhexosaminidase [Elusimicrobia bacterium]|nr:beta-N-acetylhexosaminidase [Elusimicrobiota bacterium]MDE2511461.1 beta-N-acetylhexosaminidase [Elusimicrobiota bacterium]